MGNNKLKNEVEPSNWIPSNAREPRPNDKSINAPKVNKSKKIFFGVVFLIILIVIFSENKEKKSIEVPDNKSETNTYNNNDTKPDKWWENTDKYAICYSRVTAVHKANGLHERNRVKSIQIKEELCKIAATSTTGEGSYWLK